MSSSSPTSTTSSSSALPSSTSNGSGGDLGNTSSGTGAATYYGAVALSIFILIALSLTSRVLYTRKLRRAHARERLENSRRGEEAGLPGYGESTMSPQTLSYLSSPLSYLRRPIATPSRTYHPNDVAAPPAYLSPPKYETEGEQIAMVPSDREAEVGGTGIQETDINDSPIIVTPALNSNAVVNPSPVDNPWSSDVERR